MHFFRRKLLLILFKLSDIFILIVSLVITSLTVTHQIRHFNFQEFFFIKIRVINVIVFLSLIFLWHLLFHCFRLYRSRRLESAHDEWKDIIKATTSAIAVFTMVGLLFNIGAVAPTFILVFWLSSTSLTIIFRNILRYVLKKIRAYGRNLRFILIAGTNKRAYEFAKKIVEEKAIGYRVLGYIDNNIYSPNKGIQYLGSIKDLPDLMKRHVIDEIIIALPIRSYYEEIHNIVSRAEEQGIVLRYLPQFFETKIAKSRLETFGEFTLLTMDSVPQRDSQYIAKRTLDIILASLLIILTLPLMAFTAILLKLTSNDSIFFIQKRVGYNKRIFHMYKFRTMIINADELQTEFEAFNEMDGPVFKMRKDPRITKIGRILRKLSIDELPQLFNILKGDMSLVGPRPLPVRDYSGFDQDWQRRRFSVLPGITCTWQINGRNNISFDEWMKMDMQYIDNWKLSEDIKILFKTIPAILKGTGAS